MYQIKWASGKFFQLKYIQNKRKFKSYCNCIMFSLKKYFIDSEKKIIKSSSE